MPVIANGQYRIFNTYFPTQDADLIGGQPTGVISGWRGNARTLNMVWDLTNVGNQGNQFTLANAAPNANKAYAGVKKITVGGILRGGTNRLTWTVLPTCNASEYMILAPMTTDSAVPSGLAWSLDHGTDGTPITLAPISHSGFQAYTFRPTN